MSRHCAVARRSFAEASAKANEGVAKANGGKGGIRTLDTDLNPYNGLANRCLQPLGHLSKYFFI